MAAILDYLKVITLNYDGTSSARLENLLKGQSKAFLFKQIKMLNVEEQISLIDQCLDPKTILGKRFFLTDNPFNFYGCDTSKALLKIMKEYRDSLDSNALDTSSNKRPCVI